MGTSFAPNRLQPYAINGWAYDSAFLFDNVIQKRNLKMSKSDAGDAKETGQAQTAASIQS